jgi:hypothetical protein
MVRQGWLQDPVSGDTRRFQRDPSSWSQDLRVFIDHGRPLPGQPALLRTRQRLTYREATALWRSLRRQGWRPVPPQWGEGVDT